METYSVRIYRRGRTAPHRLVGIGEQGGAPGKQAFTCLDELWGIVNPPRVRKGSGRSKEGSPDLVEGKAIHTEKTKLKKKGEWHEPEKKL